MRKKIKKLIALICIASVLATSCPIISGQTVKADALGVSEFGRVFWSLGGSFGIKPDANNTSSKFLGNLMDMYGRSFDVWLQIDKHRREDLQDVQSWQDLLNTNMQTFVKGMTKSFSHFMSDYRAGVYDEEFGPAGSVDSESFYNFQNSLNSKVVATFLSEGSNLFFNYSDVSQIATTKSTCFDENRQFASLMNTIKTQHNFNAVDFIAVSNGNYKYLFCFDSKAFLYLNSSNGFFTAYSNDNKYGYYQYYSPGMGDKNAVYDLTSEHYIRNDWNQDFISCNVSYYFNSCLTNMNVKQLEDGSFIFYSSSYDMTQQTFDTIQDSLWDQITKSSTAIDDWAIADENGKTIDDPESKILEKIYNNMLTADDIKALQNGDTSVLDKIDGMTAVNEKTGETVGDIKDTVNDAVGILGAIKLIGKNIFARQLTLINLVKSLVKGKWTSVIDNVGDITLPIIGSIESLQGIARAIQASKWVIDNVGDFTKPLINSLDNVGDLVMEKIKTVSTAIDNVNTNIASVISGCQTKVINGVKSLSDIATNILEGVKSIPRTVATAFADAFVPTNKDMDFIHTRMNTLCIDHFGVTGKELSITIPEKKFSSIYYKKKKIVDADVLNGGIDKIRPVIQGLMWFFMLLFAFNQVLEIFDKKGVGDSGDS